MFGSVRMVIMVVVFIGISGIFAYVMKLRSDNAILEANQIKLEMSIESQKKVIQKQKEDFDRKKQVNTSNPNELQFDHKNGSWSSSQMSQPRV